MSKQFLLKIDAELDKVTMSDAAQHATKSIQIHLILWHFHAEKAFLQYIYYGHKVAVMYSKTGNFEIMSTRMPVLLSTIQKLIAEWAGMHYRKDKKTGKPILPYGKWYWV